MSGQDSGTIPVRKITMKEAARRYPREKTQEELQEAIRPAIKRCYGGPLAWFDCKHEWAEDRQCRHCGIPVERTITAEDSYHAELLQKQEQE